ncbi:cell division protein ZapB [Marinospirillum insulare]|uniref:Cell division protein ZapB n=1 Tax=Marinospirillum insulare TaxID=217169 RepID=A0ABQ5ZYU3_9GAMM|nr:cell division protein ZapB [Marinospirillum insulare]GLR63502.1 cell division protein ZapB [Marinospirillum insulare]
MSLELLNQLEAKVQTTLDSLEMLRMEMDELKQENTILRNEKQAWEARLGQLLSKFSELEATAQDESASLEDETLED